MCDIYNFTDDFTVNDFVSLSVVGIKNLRVIWRIFRKPATVWTFYTLVCLHVLMLFAHLLTHVDCYSCVRQTKLSSSLVNFWGHNNIGLLIDWLIDWFQSPKFYTMSVLLCSRSSFRTGDRKNLMKYLHTVQARLVHATTMQYCMLTVSSNCQWR